MADRTGEDPPPSYDEAQRYPQFDSSGQPVSNLGPPLSQTGSIFTYNTPTTDHQETYSTQPGGPPGPAGIPRREPGAPPPEYVSKTAQYSRHPHTYGAEFGAHFGGFGDSPQTQYGAQGSAPQGPGPTAPMMAGYQGMTTVYNPVQGTVQTVSVPAGYNTTPLASTASKSEHTSTSAESEQLSRLLLSGKPVNKHLSGVLEDYQPSLSPKNKRAYTPLRNQQISKTRFLRNKQLSSQSSRSSASSKDQGSTVSPINNQLLTLQCCLLVGTVIVVGTVVIILWRLGEI